MESIWEDFKEDFKLKKLNKDIEVDICIVGLGMTAINTAYFLIKQGYKVAIIESKEYADNTSSKSTAKLTSQQQLKYTEMIKKYGIEYTKKYFNNQEQAIIHYKYIIEKENIDCDFEEKSAFLIAESYEEKEKLISEFKSYKNLNANVKFHKRKNIPIKHEALLELKKQAQFNPVKYMNGIIKVLLKNKCKIYINSKVKSINKNFNYYNIHANDNKIKCKYVILATNYPIVKFKGAYFTKLYKSTSYAISFKIKEDLINGIYINSKDPVYSYRTARDSKGNLSMIIAGFSHKTGKNIYLNNNYDELIKKAKSIYPNLIIEKKWSTQDATSVDKIPYIGKVCVFNNKILISTGYSKWGILNSMIAAKIIERRFLKEPKKEDKVFKTTRYRVLKNSKEYIKIFKDAINYFILEKISLRNYCIKKLKKGEGKVFKRKGQIVGVYKDENGKIHGIIPLCTHLKCLLNFNILEKTWDCPCHGSKYTYDGKVIYGPGVENLKKIKIK